MYRGYLIIENTFHGMFYVVKGGHNIASAKTLAEAKHAIDGLLDPSENSVDTPTS